MLPANKVGPSKPDDPKRLPGTGLSVHRSRLTVLWYGKSSLRSTTRFSKHAGRLRRDSCCTHGSISFVGPISASEAEGLIGPNRIYSASGLFPGSGFIRMLRSWGLMPSIVAGHSVGEYVAAYARWRIQLGGWSEADRCPGTIDAGTP